jgi:hypothetical protein
MFVQFSIAQLLFLMMLQSPGSLAQPLRLSQDLLYAIKTRSNYASYVDSLCKISKSELYQQLQKTETRRAFWLNIYNAYTQILLKESNDTLSTMLQRIQFFDKRAICIAGKKLSLNDIEHGMLRHSRIWWSKGLLSKWFPGKFERRMRVPLDARIHFALNCGAVSCPPIAFYSGDDLNNELNLATKNYLSNDVKVDSRTNRIYISKIFEWYSGDFGGKEGIISFLKKYELIPQDITNPDIYYNEYDWKVQLWEQQ